MNEIVGMVLAGGRSRRFNGQDKGWQPYQGKPLIEHALQQLRGCRHIVISANRNLDRYRALGVDVVVDQREDYQGPLSGIESVMQQWPDKTWFYVLACDILGAPFDWQQCLYQQTQQTASPWVGTLTDGRLQPLLGAIACSYQCLSRCGRTPCHGLYPTLSSACTGFARRH